MKTKSEIVKDWLPRYTGRAARSIRRSTSCSRNFINYVDLFAERFGVDVVGRVASDAVGDGREPDDPQLRHGQRNGGDRDGPARGDRSPRRCCFLGKCGGLEEDESRRLHPADRGDPGRGDEQRLHAAGDSRAALVPLQKAVSAMIVRHGLDYWTGTVYTTNRRVWEHDETFKDYLKKIRATAIDMETATIFIVGFVNHIPKGALLLVSDNPMTPEGVKTGRSDRSVTENGLSASTWRSASIRLIELRDSGESVKHLRFESAADSREPSR